MRSFMLSVLVVIAACERAHAPAGRSAAPDSIARKAAAATPEPACDTAPHEPARYLQLTGGVLRFEAPVGWEMPRSGGGFFSFVVPEISGEGGRAEVYVGLSAGAVGDLANATDSVLGQITARGLREVLADTMPDARHRYFWWHAEDGGTSYSVFNDFGHAGGRMAHVMISLPLLPETPPAALEAFARDTDHLLSTLTVDGQRVFPGWTMHPTVECGAPAPAADATGRS